MNRLIISFVVMSIFALIGCKGAPKPSLEINGTWQVETELEDVCQIEATITDIEVTLTFTDVVPNECEEEIYGIQNSAWTWKITSRADDFSEQGALMVTLTGQTDVLGLTASATLTETDTGLEAKILTLDGPDQVLSNVFIDLSATYPLTKRPE